MGEVIWPISVEVRQTNSSPSISDFETPSVYGVSRLLDLMRKDYQYRIPPRIILGGVQSLQDLTRIMSTHSVTRATPSGLPKTVKTIDSLRSPSWVKKSSTPYLLDLRHLRKKTAN